MECDILVIGCGMAGMASALFAGEKGLKVVQTGRTGAIHLASGFLDIMGVYPVNPPVIRENPQDAIEKLICENPLHPYAKMEKEDIFKAVDAFVSILKKAGLSYKGYENKNIKAITPVGTTKLTFRAPMSMFKGIRAMEDKKPILFVDFHGLKGFSAKQLVENLSKSHPSLKATRISFPGAKGEIFPEHIAISLEKPEIREKFMKFLASVLKGEKIVGFPAIMGIWETEKIIRYLENCLGMEIFEIPTMPPSIAGIRIRKACQRRLGELGVTTLYNKKVLKAGRNSDGSFIFHIGHTEVENVIKAKGAILATGRFLGKGLHADRKKIREPLFGLGVFQPEQRYLWHNKDFFDLSGHGINKAGIETDQYFRPIGKDKKPAYKNLYAAGSILAHQDWMREKSGSGIAIATAYGAVKGFCEINEINL